MEDIIVIVGPTGVGKTKLSLLLAKKYDAEIINGDSVSIYKRLNIGSAKPTSLEQNEAIHHLIDIKDVCEEYSVYDYQLDARKKIEEIRKRGKNIIIVGGTGLYIKAALYDYKFKSGTTYNEYNDLTNKELLKKIKEIDDNIDVHVNNRKRLVRVLNKLENNEELGTGKNNLLYNVKIIGLTTSRENLYKRINERVLKMMDEGLIDEIESLKPFYDKSLVLNTAIGYKEFRDYLFSDKKIDQVIEEIQKNSRHYAKRQYTFFNNQMDVNWFDTDFSDFNNTFLDVVNFLEK